MRLAEASRQYQIALEYQRRAATVDWSKSFARSNDELHDALEDERDTKRQMQKAWVEHCQSRSQEP